jgi:hypothetical protein
MVVLLPGRDRGKGEGGRGKGEGGRRKGEGGRRKEEGGRRKEEDRRWVGRARKGKRMFGQLPIEKGSQTAPVWFQA